MANSEKKHISLVGGSTAAPAKKRRRVKKSKVTSKGKKGAVRATVSKAARAVRYSRRGRG